MDQFMALTADTQFKRHLTDRAQRRVFPAGIIVRVHNEDADGNVLISYSAWKAIVGKSSLREVPKEA